MNSNKCYVTISYDEYDGDELHINVTHHFRQDGESYDTMIQAYINFLRGIGYIIPDEKDMV